MKSSLVAQKIPPTYSKVSHKTYVRMIMDSECDDENICRTLAYYEEKAEQILAKRDNRPNAGLDAPSMFPKRYQGGYFNFHFCAIADAIKIMGGKYWLKEFFDGVEIYEKVPSENKALKSDFGLFPDAFSAFLYLYNLYYEL